MGENNKIKESREHSEAKEKETEIRCWSAGKQ
jgi:hypothetical protein